MKKICIFCVIVILLTTMSITSCDNKIASSGENFSKPLNQLTAYNLDDFKNDWQWAPLSYRTEDGTIRLTKPLSELHSQFPIERIEVLEKDKIAAIYRLEHDGHAAYAYVIFEAPQNKFLAKNYLCWLNTNEEIYYVSAPLSSNAFAPLVVGDHISKAIEIDPAIACAFRDSALNPDVSSGGISILRDNSRAYRLLTDGVLVITFTAPLTDLHNVDANDERFTISAIDFYPYGSTDVPDYISIINYPNLLQEH